MGKLLTLRQVPLNLHNNYNSVHTFLCQAFPAILPIMLDFRPYHAWVPSEWVPVNAPNLPRWPNKMSQMLTVKMRKEEKGGHAAIDEDIINVPEG